MMNDEGIRKQENISRLVVSTLFDLQIMAIHGGQLHSWCGLPHLQPRLPHGTGASRCELRPRGFRTSCTAWLKNYVKSG